MIRIKINKKDPFVYVIAGSILAVIIILGYLGNLALKYKLVSLPSIKWPISPNSDALYYASPITTLNGAVVTKVADKAIWVEVALAPLDYSPSPTITTTATPSPIQYKKITYKIITTDQTIITSDLVTVPYTYRTVPLSSSADKPFYPPIPLNSLSQGDVVNIRLEKDLRYTRGTALTAISITKAARPNSITGTIKKASSDSLEVVGTLNIQPGLGTPTTSPETKTYTVTITPETEITRSSFEGPKKITLSEVKAKENVVVYSAEPIENTTFVAAKVSAVSIPGEVTTTIP